jgi:hypothetical protein
MFIILLSLIIQSAHAEWISVDEPLIHKSIKATLCSEFSAANETGIIIDSESCIKQASFQVFKKYLTKHEGKVVVTLLKLKIRVKSVECDGKIKKTFARYYVNHRGEVVYQKPRFDVTYVDNCELISNLLILDSNLDDDHVIKIPRNKYYKLPFKVRKKIESIDLSIELGLELDIHHKNHYKIRNEENGDTVGYIVNSYVTDLISDESYEVLVRYNTQGFHVGAIEY